MNDNWNPPAFAGEGFIANPDAFRNTPRTVFAEDCEDVPNERACWMTDPPPEAEKTGCPVPADELLYPNPKESVNAGNVRDDTAPTVVHPVLARNGVDVSTPVRASPKATILVLVVFALRIVCCTSERSAEVWITRPMTIRRRLFVSPRFDKIVKPAGGKGAVVPAAFWKTTATT